MPERMVLWEETNVRGEGGGGAEGWQLAGDEGKVDTGD